MSPPFIDSSAPALGILPNLLADQASRWGAGERVLIEEYLAKHPDLSDDAVCQLVRKEVNLRKSAGEEPKLEWSSRRRRSRRGCWVVRGSG